MKTKLLICAILLFTFTTGCSKGTEKKEKENLLTNPKSTLVEKAINKVSGMKTTCVVTEENDPIGNLNKEGSYTGAVYFRLTQVDEKIAQTEYSTPYGDDACEVGMEGGGSIEIYKNKDDAEKRNTYLSNFDGTVLASSHNIKGTVIIRLSNELTATQQKEIEKEIYNTLK